MTEQDIIAKLTQAVEAEQGILGALLIDTSAALDRIPASLKTEHFCREDHRLIFDCISRMLQQSEPVDFLTVADKLEAAGNSERAGGMAYLAELANAFSSTSMLPRYARIVIERAQVRGLLSAATEIQELAIQPGMTADEKVAKAQGLVQAIGEGAASDKPQPQRLEDALRRFSKVMMQRSEGGEVSLSTGFHDLDKQLNGGIRPGQFILVAGRPGMGKTSLAMDIARHVSSSGKTVLFCSQEMSEKDVADRWVSASARIPLERVVSAGLSDDEWSIAVAVIGQHREDPLYIDEQPALRLSDVITKARRVERESGPLSLIVIDYIQLMTGTGEDSRNAEIEVISRGLKELAKSMSCPVIALSQLSRKVEERPNKRPMPSDLRDSGSLEQDADVIAFVYRDEVYNPDSPDKGTAEILIRKNRQGAIGDIRLAWQGPYASFGALDYAAWEQQRKEHAPAQQPKKRGFAGAF